MKLKKVTSLNDLRNKAAADPQYRKLAEAAAENLGGRPNEDPFRWLEINALETDEAGVVDEINFCRDLID